jgi:hypothetical protein
MNLCVGTHVQRFSEQTAQSVQTLSQWSSAAENKHSNCPLSLAGTVASNTHNYTRPPGCSYIIYSAYIHIFRGQDQLEIGRNIVF